MKLLKRNKSEVKGWGDIKLHQLQEIYSLPEYDDKIDLMVNTLSILLDVDPNDIENMVVSDIMEEYNKWEFLKTTPEKNMIPIIKYKGKRLGFIELDKMTLGQYSDIEEYLSEGNVFDNIHKVLGTLYLPVKRYNPLNGKYVLEEYTLDPERAELFKDMGMDILYPIILFFYHIVNKYSRDLQLYFLEMKMKEMEKMISLEEEQLKKQKQEQKKK